MNKRRRAEINNLVQNSNKISNWTEICKRYLRRRFSWFDAWDEGKKLSEKYINKQINIPEELVGKTAITIVNLPPRKMMGINSEGMLISAVHEEDGHECLNLLMVDDNIPAGAKLY